MKKLTVLAAAVALCATVLAGCAGSSSLKGTTWYYSTGSEVKSVQFSSDEHAVTSEGLSLEYEIDGDTITFSSGLGGAVLTRTQTDGVDTLVGNGYIMYQDESIPQAEIDAARQAKAADAADALEQAKQQVTDEMVGTWVKSNQNSYYKYTDSWQVVYNADGTWSSSYVTHDVSKDKVVTEASVTASGRWELLYSGEDDTRYDPYKLELRFLKDDGSEFTQDEKVRDDETGYPLAVSLSQGELKPYNSFAKQ